MFVGGMIGWERELKNKPAGLRTHMLVSMGAALFVLIPLAIDNNQNARDGIGRVIQGIAAGVGFLGGGEIMRESQQEIGKPKVRRYLVVSSFRKCGRMRVVATSINWCFHVAVCSESYKTVRASESSEIVSII
jgi:putative Mg2+ transporter-C (MgtC) family protein